jgi:hypothetical protein
MPGARERCSPVAAGARPRDEGQGRFTKSYAADRSHAIGVRVQYKEACSNEEGRGEVGSAIDTYRSTAVGSVVVV